MAADTIEINFVSFLPLKAYEFALWKPEFIDKVNERAKGELKIVVRGGPEAIAMFDQAMAVKSGIADCIYTPSGMFTSVIPVSIRSGFPSVPPPRKDRTGPSSTSTPCVRKPDSSTWVAR